MDYISTTELAERWQISASRIVRLAKAGRISGAKLIGKSWVFPEDVQKPSDKRRKDNTSKKADHPFRFPLYFFCNYSDEEIENSFTKDEHALYEGENYYMTGEYEECFGFLANLLKETDDRYVRFGALYYLCLTSIFLHRFNLVYEYYNELLILHSQETLHQKELEFALHDLETYFLGNRFYLEDFAIDMQDEFPLQMREYLFLECAYSALVKTFVNKVQLLPDPFELVLRSEPERFSPLSALDMNLYVAFLCINYGRRDAAIYHIREACRIAEENNMEHSTIPMLMQYTPDLFQRALGDSNPEQLARLKKISSDLVSAMQGFLDYQGKISVLQTVDVNEARYIAFAVKGFTNKEISSILHLSENTISKKYSVIFEKTNTHSKKELVSLYNKTILNY